MLLEQHARPSAARRCAPRLRERGGRDRHSTRNRATRWSGVSICADTRRGAIARLRSSCVEQRDDVARDRQRRRSRATNGRPDRARLNAAPSASSSRTAFGFPSVEAIASGVHHGFVQSSGLGSDGQATPHASRSSAPGIAIEDLTETTRHDRRTIASNMSIGPARMRSRLSDVARSRPIRPVFRLDTSLARRDARAVSEQQFNRGTITVERGRVKRGIADRSVDGRRRVVARVHVGAVASNVSSIAYLRLLGRANDECRPTPPGRSCAGIFREQPDRHRDRARGPPEA